MSNISLKPVLFDSNKNWGDEWYFLGGTAGQQARLAAEEKQRIRDNDLTNAKKYIRHFADLEETSPAPDYLKNRLMHIDKLYEKTDSKFDMKQIEHIQHILLHAARLSGAFNEIFQNNFSNKLERSPKHPAVTVNAGLQRQISKDLLVLDMALTQRTRVHHDRPVKKDGSTATNTLSFRSHLLFLADLLAYDALQPLKDACVIPESTVAISYLRERLDIRLIPYYPVLLIGMPSALEQAWFEPADSCIIIAHEIGHYFYQFGMVNGRTVEDELNARLDTNLGHLSKTDYRKRWLEEIFADCYSCLIAGPVAILAYQEMLAARQLEDLDNELGKGKHPIPLLRPLILTNFLKQITEDDRISVDFKRAPKHLDQQWNDHLNNYGMLNAASIAEEQHKVIGIGNPKKGSDILNEIMVVTEEITKLFKEIFFAGNANINWSSWSKDTPLQPNSPNDYPLSNSVTALFHLREDYKNVLVEDNYKRVTNPPELVSPNLNFRTGGTSSNSEWDMLIETPATRAISDVVRTLSNYDSTNKMPVSIWEKAYLIKGWSDEGGDDFHSRP